MSSNRQLLADGAAKRADLVKVRLDQIRIEPGFNVSESPEDFDARVEGMVAHLHQGGRLPPIEVRDRAEGGVWLVDGQGRTEAYRRAHERGIPVADPKDGHVYILSISFVGNDADRIVRLATSAEGRTLTPMQRAEIYKRLAAFDWSVVDIARKVGRTPHHVRDMLALGNADTSVQRMVRSGAVAAGVAVAAVRKHRGAAGESLAAEVARAGGRKVTAGVVSAPAKREQAALVEDGKLLRWLLEHAEADKSSDGAYVEIRFPLDAIGFTDLRHALEQSVGRMKGKK